MIKSKVATFLVLFLAFGIVTTVPLVAEAFDDEVIMEEEEAMEEGAETYDSEDGEEHEVDQEKVDQILEEEEYEEYTVDEGDTLFEIALGHNISTKMLVELNDDLDDEEDMLTVGQELKVPDIE